MTSLGRRLNKPVEKTCENKNPQHPFWSDPENTRFGVILKRCALKNAAHSFKDTSKGWNLTLELLPKHCEVALLRAPRAISGICALRAWHSCWGAPAPQTPRFLLGGSAPQTPRQGGSAPLDPPLRQIHRSKPNQNQPLNCKVRPRPKVVFAINQVQHR